MEKKQILAIVNEICKNTLMETLKIEYVDVGENFLQARMPVNKRVYQPDGILLGEQQQHLLKVLEVQLFSY